MDAFFDALEDYLAVSETAGLPGFLGWLREAERRDSLAPRPEKPEPGCVQILTVHGSKGLEWDQVVVPRLVEDELPSKPNEGTNGWIGFGRLPWEFRGDADELPSFGWREATTRKELKAARETFKREVAEQYLESGEYLWNAGIFIVRARTFLEELTQYKPELCAALERIGAAWDTSRRDEVLATEWPELEKVSVDYAVMEPAAATGRVVTVPAGFSWSDIGDFHSLGDSLPNDENGNLVIGDRTRTLLREVKSSVIVSTVENRVIAVVGVEGLVVADTEDAVLVCPRNRAQEVKQIIETLRDCGLSDHT